MKSPSTNKKKIKAWAVINNGFSILHGINPRLVSADVFFTKSQAIENLDSRFPMFCEGCGRKNKKAVERYINVREIEITFLPITSNKKKK